MGEIIGYARVSTREQNLSSQIDALDNAGCIRIFTDKISGKEFKREGLTACLDYLRADDTLVIYRLDRLGRSVKEMLDLCEMCIRDRSTQVPMNAVYITNGTPRTIKLGNRSITFKKGTPRYFAYQSRVFTMVVTALKQIGDDKVSDEVLMKIKSILDTEEKEKVNHDYRIAPQWIRKKLKTVLYGNN